MLEELFVYATLNDKNLQKKIINRIPESNKDTLKKHYIEYFKNKGENYAFIKSDAKKEVNGLVLLVNQWELKKFDKYEGSLYQRQKVFLESGKIAWMYNLKDAIN